MELSELLVRRRRTVTGMFLLLLCSVSVLAQTNEVRWNVRPANSFDADSGTAYGVFGPVKSIDVEITIINDDQEIGALTLADGFFTDSNVALVSDLPGDRSGSGNVRWNPVARCGGPNSPSACRIDSQILLMPGDWVKATVTLDPVRGEFLAGRYRLGVDFGAARSKLLSGDLTPWRGQFATRGSVPVVVREVRTSVDRLKAYSIEAGNAMLLHDYVGALRQFQLMAAIAPDDPRAHAGIGMALLQLGRFADAALELERALPKSEKENSTVPQELAVAYLAMGQEVRAVAVLRRFYVASSVPEILVHSRERARRLPKNP